MTVATTVLHVRDRTPEQIEAALARIFAQEGRTQAMRLQGTYSAVLARLTDPALVAPYRYLILPTPAGVQWTPLLELGERADGLDRALSAALDGCAVFALFVYGEVVSGYRFVRAGVEQDRYLSDPDEFAAMESPESIEGDDTPALEEGAAYRGEPERFADLLPPSAPPEEFRRVVLRPGWWEEHERAAEASDEEMVDETDRMRCIGLALELWGASEYPFAGELEDAPNKGLSPAVALAFT